MQVYSIAAYDNGKTPEFQWSTEIGSSKFFIDNKCVLLSKLNPAICRVWMPWEVAEQAVCSSEFIVYRPKQENERIYLYALLCSQDFRQFLLSHVSGASRSRQRVSPKETLQFQISYPSKEALVSFTARVKPLYERIYLGEKQRKKLINYRDRALNVIFASQGEVLR